MLTNEQNIPSYHIAESTDALHLRSRFPTVFTVLACCLMYLLIAVGYQCLVGGLTALDWQGVLSIASILFGGCCTTYCSDGIYFDTQIGMCKVERIRHGFHTGHFIAMNDVLKATVDLIDPAASGQAYARVTLLTSEGSYPIGFQFSRDVESVEAVCERINRFIQHQKNVLVA